MKIAVVNDYIPFIYGGAEFLADTLTDKLVEYGHQAIVVKIPFQWHPPEKLFHHMLAARLMHVTDYFDRVIALKFPAYYVEHPDKVLWLLHQFKQVYELWGTQYQSVPPTPEGEAIRDAIIRADNRYLAEAKKIYTNSSIVKDRLQRFNGIGSEVLYPPLLDAEKFYCHEYGDYIFFPSRISGGKRQHLVIESMRYTRSDVKLIIAGNPDDEPYRNHLHGLVDRHDLHHKVQIIDHFIAQEEKIRLFADALGCVYTPLDEDSYGFVTLEAYYARKPVITCTDSGGTDEVVRDGLTGWIVAPEPQAIAEAMDKLHGDKRSAERLGRQGLEHVLSLKITWDHVIRRLTI